MHVFGRRKEAGENTAYSAMTENCRTDLICKKALFVPPSLSQKPVVLAQLPSIVQTRLRPLNLFYKPLSQVAVAQKSTWRSGLSPLCVRTPYMQIICLCELCAFVYSPFVCKQHPDIRRNVLMPNCCVPLCCKTGHILRNKGLYLPKRSNHRQMVSSTLLWIQAVVAGYFFEH